MDELDGFVPIEDAAKRMKLTVEQVLALVSRRVLRAYDLGGGLILVQPAILSGAV